MGMKTKPSKASAKKVVMPSKEAIMDCNNNEAGELLLSKLVNDKTIEYASRDIMLSDIRLNPDNEVFRQDDNDEDIRTLAEDIERNGLMHNLVVLPQQEGKNTVYMLISGERRYRALKYLEEKDASWNTVKHCNVITSDLTDNEKKVLLYSANLQVRGGFGNEKIRRKAMVSFIECLQKSPYNLTEAQAKKTIKSLSPENTKTLDRDIRTEKNLCTELKELLDGGYISRSEADIYLHFPNDKQVMIAEKLQGLFAVDCHSDAERPDERNSVEVRRDNLHITFREALFAATKAGTFEELDAMFAKALEDYETGLKTLNDKAAEYAAAKANNSEKQMEEFEYDNKNQAAKEKNDKKKTVRAEVSKNAAETVVQKKAPGIKNQLDAIINRKNYVKSLRKQSPEVLEQDIRALNEVIATATVLKEMIEKAQRQDEEQ